MSAAGRAGHLPRIPDVGIIGTAPLVSVRPSP
jgi:hypothetical protein